MPARRLSSMCICRWLSSSSAKSRSRASFEKSPLNLATQARSCLMTILSGSRLILGGREEAGDNGRRLVPFVFFAGELFAARAGELVVLGFAVVFGNAPLGSNRALLFQFEQRRIE